MTPELRFIKDALERYHLKVTGDSIRSMKHPLPSGFGYAEMAHLPTGKEEQHIALFYFLQGVERATHDMNEVTR